MISYLDKILYLYPDIQGVSFWQTKYDGSAWDDAYDGIVWENAQIAKPTKETLDALDDTVVQTELASRGQTARKTARDAKYKDDVYMIAKYQDYVASNPTATFSVFLDSLETARNLLT